MRRYQVFVSSTYADLLEERAEVMQALLELDCMPAGMELFPAANEEQWTWIKRVIDESDYYLVIVGGRYGSVSGRTGQSYTEMEYRYALEVGKPAIAFLHADPGRIPANKTDSNAQSRRKLEQFRALLETKLCKYWSSPSDLGAKVSRSLTQLIKHNPAIGWVRASDLPEDRTEEVLDLRREVEHLRKQLQEYGVEDLDVTRTLARGTDKFKVGFVVQVKEPRTNRSGRPYWTSGEDHDESIQLTWDELFIAFAEVVVGIRQAHSPTWGLNSLIEAKAAPTIEKKYSGKRVGWYRILTSSADSIQLQLTALGLVKTSDKGGWQLTPQGERYFIQLRAIHRK